MPASTLNVASTRLRHSLWMRFESLSPWKAATLAGLLCWGISTFLYAPPFWLPLTGGTTPPSRIDDFIALCKNPLARDLHEPILAYRITTPALAWILGLRGFSGVLLQYLAIPATLGLVYFAMAGRTTRRIALLSTLGVACSYAIIWTNTKPGFPDSITHLAVAILLVTRHPLVLVTATVLGTLNDERFVLAIPFLLLWHTPPGSFVELLKASWTQALLFILALVIVLAVRTGLTNGSIGPGIVRPEIYDGINQVASFKHGSPHDGWHQYWVNILMSFRFLWLLIPIALFSMTRWAHRSIFTLSLLLVIFSSGFVADVSRSIGFAFPAFLIAAAAIADTAARPLRLLSVAVFLCLLFPAFHVNAQTSGTSALNVQLERPLPLSIARAVTGWDIMDLLR